MERRETTFPKREVTVVGEPQPKPRQPFTSPYAKEVKRAASNLRLGIIRHPKPVKVRITFITRDRATEAPLLCDMTNNILWALKGVWYDDVRQVAQLQCRMWQGDHPRAMIAVEEADARRPRTYAPMEGIR